MINGYYNDGIDKIHPNLRMTTLYTYRFDNDLGSVSVHFIDDNYDVSNAEQLAQIGHQKRRDWASRMINFIRGSLQSVWTSFDLKRMEKCSFGQRLETENWINPAVVLMDTDGQCTLYIYRFYFSIFNHFK